MSCAAANERLASLGNATRPMRQRSVLASFAARRHYHRYRLSPDRRAFLLHRLWLRSRSMLRNPSAPNALAVHAIPAVSPGVARTRRDKRKKEVYAMESHAGASDSPSLRYVIIGCAASIVPTH